MGRCEELLESINSKVSNIEKIQTSVTKVGDDLLALAGNLYDSTEGDILVIKKAISTLQDSIDTVSKNQEILYKNIKVVSTDIGKLNKNVVNASKISIENNKYLKDIQKVNYSLPPTVLQQIANTEAIAKGLNNVLLQ